MSSSSTTSMEFTNYLIHFSPIASGGCLAVLLLGFCALELLLLRWGCKNKRYHLVDGTIFNQLLNFRRLHDFCANHALKHRTYRLLSPFRSEIYTADPTNVEYILRTNFRNYGKGKYNYCIMEDLLGDGIFAVDGEKWRHQRKIAIREFSRRDLKDYSTKVFKNNAGKLASAISRAASSCTEFDIQDLFMKTTMDSIFQVVFGVELDSLCGSSKEEVEFAEAFDDSSALITWRYVDITWKIKRFFNIGCEATRNEKIKVVDSFVYRMINKKIEEMSKPSSKQPNREDIMSRFLIERERDPLNITSKYLKDIILNFFIAGKDTTAITLSWFFYMLCKHPSIQEKVFQEVIIATQNDRISSFGFPSSITEEAIDKMHYLHATLTETLRLYPAVPVDPKFCFSDDTLPDGFHVRKGDMVAYLPYAMGRMKFIWGEQAEEFRPERWLDDYGIFSPESPFKFTAFQGGPRICLGKDFAYRQMKVMASVLIGLFQFKLADEKKSITYRTMLTLQIDQGLHLLAFRRQNHK